MLFKIILLILNFGLTLFRDHTISKFGIQILVFWCWIFNHFLEKLVSIEHQFLYFTINPGLRS